MIVVTGIGAITALGATAQETFDALCEGRSGIVEDTHYRGKGLVASIPGGPHLSSTLALRAVREALGSYQPPRLGIVGASTSGDMVEGERDYRHHLRTGEVLPGYLWAQLADRPAQVVQSALGIPGPRTSVSTACTSGGVAVGVAADWIRDGVVDAVVAFGADALCGITVHGFGALGVPSAEACRPFDVERTGLSLGEGAGALLLESRASAEARGAPILAEVVGYGNASDAHHMTAPHPEGRGARDAIQQALMGLDPLEVGLVSAHATATQLNDAMEASVLGDLLPHAAVFGVKGALGHTLGAAGAIELIVAIQSLLSGKVPGTVGLHTSGFAIDVHPHTRDLSTHTALSVNFAFGGNNVAVAVRR